MTADQDQRSDQGCIGGVEVLRDGLEDFLHCAGLPRQIHDATPAATQQRVFAQRVGEVLGDLAGEDVGWLVAVEPGRDAEAATRAADGLTVPHLEGASYPGIDAGSERRRQFHDRQRLVE